MFVHGVANAVAGSRGSWGKVLYIGFGGGRQVSSWADGIPESSFGQKIWCCPGEADEAGNGVSPPSRRPDTASRLRLRLSPAAALFSILFSTSLP